MVQPVVVLENGEVLTSVSPHQGWQKTGITVPPNIRHEVGSPFFTRTKFVLRHGNRIALTTIPTPPQGIVTVIDYNAPTKQLLATESKNYEPDIVLFHHVGQVWKRIGKIPYRYGTLAPPSWAIFDLSGAFLCAEYDTGVMETSGYDLVVYRRVGHVFETIATFSGHRVDGARSMSWFVDDNSVLEVYGSNRHPKARITKYCEGTTVLPLYEQDRAYYSYQNHALFFRGKKVVDLVLFTQILNKDELFYWQGWGGIWIRISNYRERSDRSITADLTVYLNEKPFHPSESSPVIRLCMVTSKEEKP